MTEREPLAPGTTLADGRYTIRKLLGQGGSALTYEAGEGAWDLSVCIKEFFPIGAVRSPNGLKPATADYAERMAQGLQAFIGEADTLARFAHPGVVRVLGRFSENRTVYLVQEVLVGMTLSDVLAMSGKMKEPAILKIAQQVGQALLMVHGAGLVHSDLKPGNLFLTKEGRYVLLDFGLTRGFLSRDAAERGGRGFTPGFAPPEQIQESQKLTPASDVYSFAATLYSLYTGMPPTDAALRCQGQALAAIRNPSLTPRCNEALLQALTLDPRQRTPGVREFLHQMGLETSPKFVAYKPPGFTQVKKIRAHLGGLTAMALRGSILYTGGRDGSVKAFSWPELEPLASVGAHSRPVSALAVAHHGQFLVSGCEAGEIRLWDAALGQAHPLWNEASAVTALACHPGKDRALAAFESGLCAVLSPSSSPLRWNAHKGAVNSLSVHGNGKLMATGGEDGAVRFWLLSEGTEVNALPGATRAVQWVAFSPDGAGLLTAGNDQWARCWDLAGPSVLREFKEHTAVVLRALFCCDARTVLTLSGDRQLRAFSLDHGRVTRQCEAHSDPVRALVADPGRPLAASAAANGELILWEWEGASADHPKSPV